MFKPGPAPKHIDCGGPVHTLYVKVGPKDSAARPLPKGPVLVPVGQACLRCGANSFRAVNLVAYLDEKGYELNFSELHRRFPHLGGGQPPDSGEPAPNPSEPEPAFDLGFTDQELKGQPT
jgi:hypothetical protein